MPASYEALRAHAAWINLSDRGKIRVTGEDRARLLHAMSTNDVQHLGSGDGLYAFFLSPVGRILSDAYIYNLGDSLWLDTEPETAEKLAEHLDKYIIADDAAVENETGRWVCIGIEGPRTQEITLQLAVPVPQNRYGVQPWPGSDPRDGFVARTACTGHEGVRVFLPADSKSSLLARMTELGLLQATAAEARLVRMENGIPRYGDEITERYLVQETRQMHAVHSNKGCYLGQEIVERVRSRGQVHRVLMPLLIHTTTPPAPGTKLMDGNDTAAEITSAEFSPALGAVVAFAYVRSGPAQAKPPLAVANSDPPVIASFVQSPSSLP